jgi:acetyltransferase-like isoleucine patch superfamily enzyme
VRIGVATIINTGVIVEHDCQVGSFVHLAPAVVLAGRVEVKDMVFLGIGTLVTPDVSIGFGAFSGAGAVITKQVGDEKILLGYRATIGDQMLYKRVVGKK